MGIPFFYCNPWNEFSVSVLGIVIGSVLTLISQCIVTKIKWAKENKEITKHLEENLDSITFNLEHLLYSCWYAYKYIQEFLKNPYVHFNREMCILLKEEINDYKKLRHLKTFNTKLLHNFETAYGYYLVLADLVDFYQINPNIDSEIHNRISVVSAIAAWHIFLSLQSIFGFTNDINLKKRILDSENINNWFMEFYENDAFMIENKDTGVNASWESFLNNRLTIHTDRTPIHVVYFKNKNELVIVNRSSDDSENIRIFHNNNDITSKLCGKGKASFDLKHTFSNSNEYAHLKLDNSATNLQEGNDITIKFSDSSNNSFCHNCYIKSFRDDSLAR